MSVVDSFVVYRGWSRASIRSVAVENRGLSHDRNLSLVPRYRRTRFATLEMDRPRAFISHSTADQERFVDGFARALNEMGVEAWYSGWDLAPGDNLVEKIFEQGLRDAATVVVVVSKSSIQSAWVQAELSTAVVRNIEREVRIIPVVLDECELPVALERFVWVRIDDVDNCGPAAERIAMAIHGVTRRPEPGGPPGYIREGLPRFAGLSPVDGLVLSVVVELVLERSDRVLAAADVRSAVRGVGVGATPCDESILVLADEGLFKVSKMPDGKLRFVETTYRALQRYVRDCAPALLRDVALCIQNRELREAEQISSALGAHLLLVIAALKELALQRAVRLADTGDSNAEFGRSIRVLEVSPRLRRLLEGQ